MFSLKNKCAFVTGGSSGIGLAIVERFTAAGAKVVIADLSPPDGLEKLGARYVAADISEEDQLVAALESAQAQIGNLDIVVNNAGIGPEEGSIRNLDMELLDKILAVNVKGVLFGLKHAPAFMNDGGSIINTASLAASLTIPEYTGYAISKASVVSMTRQAAVDLAARGIRVNAVCPGTTTTPMESADSDESQLCKLLCCAGRPGLPEEQAAVFHFLASDDASYVNAQAIYADGGWINGLTQASLKKLLAPGSS